MKKLFFSLVLLSSTAVFAQRRHHDDNNNNDRNQPPATVQRSFERENPNRNATWTQSNNQWHATYKDDNNRDVEAHYDGYGRRRDTHIAWNRNEVPRDLDDRINRMYHPRNYNAIRIERPYNQPLFQISLDLGGGRNRTVYMDERGRQRQYYDHH